LSDLAVAWPRKRDERPAQVRYKGCPPRSVQSPGEEGGALMAVMVGTGPA